MGLVNRQVIRQMKCLRIKDNTQVKKAAFSDISKLVEKISDRTLDQLERDGVFVFPSTVRGSEDLTEEHMILRSMNDYFVSGNVMGYIGCGDERLVIGSRFGSDDNDYLFQYLLEKVVMLPNSVALETDANQQNRLFQLLLFLFPHYLRTAMRKGPYKQYIRRQYNDSNIKGSIDIARHIIKNTPFTGNIAYSQREFSYDNHLMELIRHTIEYIKGKPYGRHLLSKVNDEVKIVIKTTPEYKMHDRRKVIDQNKKNIVRHAYYKEYFALQHLCMLILQHQKHQIGSGSRQVYGVLFDGSWLWEEYIYVLIKDFFHHPKNKTGEGAQYLFGGHKGRIYPDYISKSTEPRIIADAKYKPIDNIGKNQNKDYFQMLSYMFRFDAKEGFFLYPESGDTEDSRMQVNRGSTYDGNVEPRDDISVIKHGLKIPAGTDSYENFVLRIKDSEEEFRNAFAGSLTHA